MTLTVAQHGTANRVVLGAASWFVGEVAFFAAQVVVAGRWSPAYSWSRNYISDLGNTACGPFAVPHGTAAYVCSPWHAGMNAAFVLAGVLTVAGALLLRETTVATVLLVVAGVGKIGVGLVPENTDIGQHTLAALNVPILSVAVLLIGLSRKSATTMVLAVAGLIGTVLSVAGQYGGPAAYLGLGAGGMERVADYPGAIWMIIAAWTVWRGRGRHVARTGR
jgi:hypothetical membrane protein